MHGAQVAIPLLILLALVVWRVLRLRGTRPLNPAALLLMSALILYASLRLVAYGADMLGMASGRTPAHRGLDPAAVPLYAIGALLGLGLGVLRGRTIAVFRDPTTGRIMQKGGLLSLLIWLALFALRVGIHALVGAGLAGAWAVALGDILLLLGTGSILGRNAYLLLRYAQLTAAPAALGRS